jgi:hypothetical protein
LGKFREKLLRGIGYWMLVTGCWILSLVIGEIVNLQSLIFWETGYSMLDAGYWSLGVAEISPPFYLRRACPENPLDLQLLTELNNRS